MNKELTPLEAYNELKSYLEDILNCTCNSNAMRHTDSFVYLMPFIAQVETALKDKQALEYNYNKLMEQQKYWRNKALKYQKEHKALEIIYLTNADIAELERSVDVQTYNSNHFSTTIDLVPETFDLLKEVLK